MAAESLLSVMPIPPVQAKPDVTRVSPDGQEKRGEDGHKGRRDREADETESPASAAPHPVPNTQGQITGKLIDTTA